MANILTFICSSAAHCTTEGLQQGRLHTTKLPTNHENLQSEVLGKGGSGGKAAQRENPGATAYSGRWPLTVPQCRVGLPQARNAGRDAAPQYPAPSRLCDGLRAPLCMSESRASPASVSPRRGMCRIKHPPTRRPPGRQHSRARGRSKCNDLFGSERADHNPKNQRADIFEGPAWPRAATTVAKEASSGPGPRRTPLFPECSKPWLPPSQTDRNRFQQHPLAISYKKDATSTSCIGRKQGSNMETAVCGTGWWCDSRARHAGRSRDTSATVPTNARSGSAVCCESQRNTQTQHNSGAALHEVD